MEKEVLNELIANLLGTMLSIEEVAEEMGFNVEDLSYEDWRYIDESIFLCEVCGWWCESPSWDGLCLDCWEEEEQEDYE
jgi:hypothetical protein